MTDNLTLRELISAGTGAELLVAYQLFKKFNQPYSTFVEIVNRALDYSSTMMSIDKNILSGMNEDQLTTLLLAPLKTIAIDACHDSNVGGHCDISINGGRGMLWLGEAKIFSAYGTILGGYQQLVARYSTGLPNQNNGGLVIYMKGQNAKNMIGQWKEYLTQTEPTTEIKVDAERPLEFWSECEHSGSGLSIYVRHFPVVLYHNPVDQLAKPKRIRKPKAA